MIKGLSYLEKRRQDLVDSFQEVLKQDVATLFINYPTLNALMIRSYQQVYNDGEPTNHYMHFLFEMTDEKWNLEFKRVEEWEDVNLEGNEKHYHYIDTYRNRTVCNSCGKVEDEESWEYPEGLIENLGQFQNSVETMEDFFIACFGDEKEVTLYRDGTLVIEDYYDHM